MPVPLVAALPAAAASLAYLNAKYAIVEDLQAITAAVGHEKFMPKLEEQDRVNLFYRFEELAKLPNATKQVFLVVPKDPASPYAKTEWTYAEAYRVVLQYARWLKETHKVQKNEIIAMDFKNKPQFIWMWFSLWSLGAIPAFINSNLQDTAFIHCVRISTSRLLVLDSELQHILTEDARKQLGPDDRGRATETCVLDSYTETYVSQLEPFRAPDEVRSGALIQSASILIYTSGTTGLPKAANVNWGKPVSGAFFFPKLVGMQPTDRYYTPMPLYHSSASVLGVSQVLGVGNTIILAPKFSARTQMKEITETKATVMQYIGEMCRYLVNSPASPYDQAHSVRLAFGNGMRPDVWPKFKKRFNIGTIFEFYGATEGPGASFVKSNNGFYEGAIGRGGGLMRMMFGSRTALLKYDVEADQPWRNPQTGFCERVEPDQPGELVYALDPENIKERFQGYVGNEKATSSKILRNVFANGDVYYRTGDLQRKDSDGRIWFVDRIGDTFRWKGENVSTAEVAEILGASSGIEEANVYGVQLPSHDGRAGCAAITLKPGKSLDEQARRSLAELARAKLPKYAVPLFLRVLKEVELTGTMKHQKVALRKAGVDPSQTGEDEIFWLPPGAGQYQPFGKSEWQKIVAGESKL